MVIRLGDSKNQLHTERSANVSSLSASVTMENFTFQSSNDWAHSREVRFYSSSFLQSFYPTLDYTQFNDGQNVEGVRVGKHWKRGSVKQTSSYRNDWPNRNRDGGIPLISASAEKAGGSHV